MKTNTHGLIMTGLKKASGETKNYGAYSPTYAEVFYDKSTGEIWTRYHYSLGQNSWTQYDDPNVIRVCTTSKHLTMQAIADMIADAVTAA